MALLSGGEPLFRMPAGAIEGARLCVLGHAVRNDHQGRNTGGRQGDRK